MPYIITAEVLNGTNKVAFLINESPFNLSENTIQTTMTLYNLNRLNAVISIINEWLSANGMTLLSADNIATIAANLQ